MPIRRPDRAYVASPEPGDLRGAADSVDLAYRFVTDAVEPWCSRSRDQGGAEHDAPGPHKSARIRRG